MLLCLLGKPSTVTAWVRAAHLLEVGKQVAPIPAIVTKLAPSIIIRLSTTIVTHTVHDGTTSKDLTGIGYESLILEILLRGTIDLEHVRIIVSGTIIRPQSLG